ncbi:threonylcarbamoyl-AMP synthase [Candidatus Woesearchaeota archaeon]|nr:threonylcarbamoyl-AMP synthase [Candidatus Woesearchaeota archaeon]
MEILTQTESRLRQDEIIQKIREGVLFIHPTDTIYGLGCNALNEKAVRKIRALKQRPAAPFSIWVPSLEWVHENCLITSKVKKWLQELPGPYTFILQLKDTSAVAKSVIPETDFIGIRYPDHWFGKIVEKSAVPIITTSANKTGQPFMTSIEDLDPEIEKGVEFMIYEGPKEGSPSKIVHVEKEEIRER